MGHSNVCRNTEEWEGKWEGLLYFQCIARDFCSDWSGLITRLILGHQLSEYPNIYSARFLGEICQNLAQPKFCTTRYFSILEWMFYIL